MSYHIGAQSVVGIPIYVRHNISFKDIAGGRLDITVGPRQTVGRTASRITNKSIFTKFSTEILRITVETSGGECCPGDSDAEDCFELCSESVAREIYVRSGH